jgi:heptaprenyl diphosphate synthase
MKLGLANVVTLLALCLLKKRFACMVLLCRCIFGAVFGGGITGFAFSLCGGFLSLGVMAAAEKASLFSVFGISIMGAAAHNIGQILISMVLMRSLYIGAYLPYLLITAVFTGFLTGSLCAGILRVLPKATKVPRQMQR